MVEVLTPPCYYRISVKALILDDQQRFLLVKEDNGLRDFPGWWLDHDETPEEALKREIFEEMGLEVLYVKDTPSYFLTSKNRSGEIYIANVLFETTVKDFNFTPSAECVELRFFTIEDAKKEHLFPNIPKFLALYHS